MTDLTRPRRGSMAFRPRKRAIKQNAQIYWQEHAIKRLLGFAGYKVGMTHLSYIDTREKSTKGQEVVGAATIIETPPIHVYGYRCYTSNDSNFDVLSSDANTIKLLKIKKQKQPKTQEKSHEKPNEVKDVRLLVFAQPNKTHIGKKHIERMEIALGGKDVNEKLEFSKSLLGKELRISDVFKAGEYVDVAAVTRGKGWQGAVKRFGVAKQRRKATGKQRHVGTLGQWHPAYVLYTVPQAGQTGYHTRTELNKQIMKIGNNIEEINPNSGFPSYGFVKNDYVLLKGSIPGPTKRLIKLRLAVRESAAQAQHVQQKEPHLLYISK